MRVMRRQRAMASRVRVRNEQPDQYDGEDWAIPGSPWGDDYDYVVVEGFPGGKTKDGGPKD